jgi:hypothetical protein
MKTRQDKHLHSQAGKQERGPFSCHSQAFIQDSSSNQSKGFCSSALHPMDPATATAASVHARRRSSISDYSSLFSNGQPKASSFVGKTRHPSLTMSMKGERPAGFSALQRAMSSATSQGDNEQAIVDDELSQSTGSIGNAAAGGAAASVDGNTAQHKRSLTDDPVGLARRLSQGARAIMYNGNRLKGDGVAPLKRAPSTVMNHCILRLSC